MWEGEYRHWAWLVKGSSSIVSVKKKGGGIGVVDGMRRVYKCDEL